MSDRETEQAISRLRASLKDPDIRVLGWRSARRPADDKVTWWRVRAAWRTGAVMLFSVTAPDEDAAKSRVREFLRAADAVVHVAPEVPPGKRAGGRG